MSLYDNEENAIVNNDNDVSETPSNLVNNNLGLETSQEELDKKLQYKRDGNVNESKLSPNPAGFGFIKQLFVTPENTATNGEPNLPGEPNVLYLVQVLNNGLLVGYRKYKWTPSDGFVQFGATPDLKLKDSPRETPTRVENEPKKNLAQVFNGDVAVNGDLFVNGQKIEKAAAPLTPSEVVDIVNEGIEGGDIEVGTEVVANPTLAGTEDALTGLQIGDTKYAVGGEKLYRHRIKLGSMTVHTMTFNTSDNSITHSSTSSTVVHLEFFSHKGTKYSSPSSLIQAINNGEIKICYLSPDQYFTYLYYAAPVGSNQLRAMSIPEYNSSLNTITFMTYIIPTSAFVDANYTITEVIENN